MKEQIDKDIQKVLTKKDKEHLKKLNEPVENWISLVIDIIYTSSLVLYRGFVILMLGLILVFIMHIYKGFTSSTDLVGLAVLGISNYILFSISILTSLAAIGIIIFIILVIIRDIKQERYIQENVEVKVKRK